MKKFQFSKKVTAILVYGRPPLVFGGLCCAIAVMWTQNPVLYTLGVVFLFTAMAFDLVDGWFAARFQPVLLEKWGRLGGAVTYVESRSSRL